MKNYVTYHLHTELSLLDSTTNYKLYIDKARELKQPAIAFTEHGNIYSWCAKKLYCDQNNLKYIHGVEAYITFNLNEKIRDNYHTILLAKNYEGVKEINQLINTSTLSSHFYYKPRITVKEFLNISDNVIKISACLASPLNHIKEIGREMFFKCLHAYDYLEIQPHINSPEQKEYNKTLAYLSQKHLIPLIAGTDTHSLNKYKAECRTILQRAKRIEFANEDQFDLTYKSYDELIDMFKKQGAISEKFYWEAIQNTNEMANKIENFKLDMSFKYPNLYDDDEKVFAGRIKEKYKEKIKNGIINHNPQYIENMKEEVRVFKKIGMMGFMLFISELMTWCRENNIPSSPCRGSVGGSTIAYITDITDVDPIKWKTVFSRFANEDRIEIGDIDVDFAPNQRDRVYEYIINRFGKSKTAYVLALGTISEKATIDEIGRALNYSLDKVAQIKLEYEEVIAEKNKEEKIKKKEKISKKHPDLFYYFDGMLGTVVSQSMHPAGIIVSPITLPDNYGTFWREEKQILCLNMDECHEVSLVKYDILALKNIQIINETCKLAKIKYPLSHELNWTDETVWKNMLLSPTAIFQFEGDYAFSLLKEFNPKNIFDMNLVTAAVRPSGESYRDRLMKKEIHKNPDQIIDEMLKDNYGYLCFQEDVIKFLQEICGLTGSEADNLRRAIGRKQKDRLEKALPQVLEGYCNKSNKSRELAEEEAKQFLKIIEDSSNYMFGFNHSTGYSMVGYLCAYMRHYYPLEFVTAYLNCANSLDDISKGNELAKLLGITLKDFEFGKSIAKYTFDKQTNTIYKGVSSIKFLNKSVAEELYKLAQKNNYMHPFPLLHDISTKTSADTRQIEILIALNFFKPLGFKNKQLLDFYRAYKLLNNRKQIKYADIEKLEINEDLLKRCAEKQTEKMYRDIDMSKYLTEVFKEIKNVDLSIKNQIKVEINCLGEPISKLPSKNDNFFSVIDLVERNGKTKPHLTLYSLCTGEKIKTRIIDSEGFSRIPIKVFDVVEVLEWEDRFKSKIVGDKWIKTKETEKILKEWVVY